MPLFICTAWEGDPVGAEGQELTFGYLMSFFDLGNSATTLELSLIEAVFEV